MANKIWVLGNDGNANYQCVIHTPTPVGNNSANVPWPTVLSGVGLNNSVLPIGANGFQQTQAEHDAVASGTIVELATTLKIDSAQQTPAQITVLAQAAISDYLALLGRQYKWYGYNQAA